MEKLLPIAIYSSWGLWLIYSYLSLFSKRRKPGLWGILVSFAAGAILLILLKSSLMIAFTAVGLLFLALGVFQGTGPQKGLFSFKPRKTVEDLHQSSESPPSEGNTKSIDVQIRAVKDGPSGSSWVAGVTRSEVKTKVDFGAESPSRFHGFFGTGLVTISLLALFLFLAKDFKSGSDFFITGYNYNIDSAKKEVIIGNSPQEADISLENSSAAGSHLRVSLKEKNYSIQNISDSKQVDLNGKYLNMFELKEGDHLEINGRERLKILKINRQFPLGRSLQVAFKQPGKSDEQLITLHTLLNKRLILQYQWTKSGRVSTDLQRVNIPGSQTKPVAFISYEPNRYILGMNIYYIIVILAIAFLSAGIYLYLKNRFNGALLLFLLVSLPFLAGFVSLTLQLIVTGMFIPVIILVQRRRRRYTDNTGSPETWGMVLLVLLFAALYAFPIMLRMDGAFTVHYYDYAQTDSLRVLRGNERISIKDISKSLEYYQNYKVILGHTAYRLNVNPKTLSFSPLDPEKIKISPSFKAIISNLDHVTPGDDFVYLKYPKEFSSLPAEVISNQKKLSIHDDKGNSIGLSKVVNKNYNSYLNGLVLFILIPFWLFLFFYFYGPVIYKKWVRKKRALPSGTPLNDGYGNMFTRNTIILFQWVFFMLGLGYVVFGALALYNNNIFKNFLNFKTRALPAFVFLLLISLVLSQYNRWVVFILRMLKQKKFHVPLLVGLFLMLLVNYHYLFLYGGMLFLIFVYGFRLRRDIYYEYINTHSITFDLQGFIEKTVSSFEDKANQRVFFGLGGVLNKKGWNYLLVSDVLLLMALFFIVMQLFLGGELGVPLAGFLFLPIELGKILLTVFFADWVSRIDRGMELNVLWIYGLVMVPFVLLVVFLKDFSPLMVFSFVFLYHIIKINVKWIFKAFLMALLVLTVVTIVSDLSRYTFPFRYFAVMVSVVLLFLILRIWGKPGYKALTKGLFSLAPLALLAVVNYTAFVYVLPAPRALATRIDSWLHPWQDYNLSYQYINSLWLMKGAGTFGKSAEALTAAGHVPLVEKDLGFSLYVSVLGTLGAVLIFFTLLLVMVYVHRLVRMYGKKNRGSPFRWYIYLAEFLVVIFMAQFIVPALYTVGLLPIMGQPLPFLSYSNNILLLFALPFSFLMVIIGSCLAREAIDAGLAVEVKK